MNVGLVMFLAGSWMDGKGNRCDHEQQLHQIWWCLKPFWFQVPLLSEKGVLRFVIPV